MPLKNKPILGISLGTHHVGIAVISDSNLLYWRTRKFKGAWSPQRLEKILSLIWYIARRYNITAIAVKVPPNGHLSKGLKELVLAISKTASEHNVDLKPYRIQELKQFLSKKSLNKKALMLLVCNKYPFLERNYHRELSNRQPYHIKMFEAVLAAMCLDAKQLHQRIK